MKKLSVHFEWTNPLADYVEESGSETADRTEAIEEATLDTNRIVEEVNILISSYGLKENDFEITNIEFLECDSSNPSHGSAYFQVELTADEDKMEAFKKKFKEEEDIEL